MGMLMWNEDPELRDVVVLDAIRYFVRRITQVICKHKPTGSDPTSHHLPIHKRAMKLFWEDWTELVHEGKCSEPLLRFLLQETEDGSSGSSSSSSSVVKLVEDVAALANDRNIDKVVHLMVKFGLIVRVETQTGASGAASASAASEGDPNCCFYYVPSLLPELSPSDLAALRLDSSEWSHGCSFVFTTSRKLLGYQTVTEQDIRLLGFLPSGLFERLLCRVLNWIQSMGALSTMRLFRDLVSFYFGSQQVVLRVDPGLRAIDLRMTGSNPLAIHRRCSEMLQDLLSESMRGLHVLTVLKFDSSSSSSSSSSESLFIPLDRIYEAVRQQSVLCGRVVGSRPLMTPSELKRAYLPWLPPHERGDGVASFDVFISYRWSEPDKLFTRRLFDSLSTFNVGQDNRSVEVFLDIHRLRDGQQFQRAFSASLLHAKVVVPIVSSEALGRLLSHDPSAVDNLLLEWILTLELSQQPGSSVSVFPVLFGTRVSLSSAIVSGADILAIPSLIGDLEKENVVSRLPEVSPTATLGLARQLLAAHKLTPSSLFEHRTVRSAVVELKGFLGYLAHTAPMRSPKRSIDPASDLSARVQQHRQMLESQEQSSVVESSSKIVGLLRERVQQVEMEARSSREALSRSPSKKGLLDKPSVVSSPQAAGGTELESWLRRVDLGEYCDFFVKELGAKSKEDFLDCKGLSLKELEENIEGLSTRLKPFPRKRFHKMLNEWLSES